MAGLDWVSGSQVAAVGVDGKSPSSDTVFITNCNGSSNTVVYNVTAGASSPTINGGGARIVPDGTPPAT